MSRAEGTVRFEFPTTDEKEAMSRFTKLSWLPVLMLASTMVLTGCGGGAAPVDDTATSTVPAIEGETTADTPAAGEAAPAPATTEEAKPEGQ